MGKLIGPLQSCTTPFCGLVIGYFCVKCRHYLTECRCGYHSQGCACRGNDYRKWWAGPGERRALERELAKEEECHA